MNTLLMFYQSLNIPLQESAECFFFYNLFEEIFIEDAINKKPQQPTRISIWLNKTRLSLVVKL